MKDKMDRSPDRKRAAIVAIAVASLFLAVGNHASAKKASNENADGKADNSGRQLASVVPGMPRPQPVNVMPAVVKKNKEAAANSNREIRVPIPKSVDEAADVIWVTARKVGKEGEKKAGQVVKWFAALWKQMNSHPTITPAGSPYVFQNAPSTHGAKLYFTHEGRLKTVVKR